MSVDCVEKEKSIVCTVEEFDRVLSKAIEQFEFEEMQYRLAAIIEERRCICGEIDLVSGESIPCPRAAFEDVKLYSHSDETVRMCDEHSSWPWQIGD